MNITNTQVRGKMYRYVATNGQATTSTGVSSNSLLDVSRGKKGMGKYEHIQIKESWSTRDSHLSHYRGAHKHHPTSPQTAGGKDSLWTTHIMSVCSGYLA